MYFPIILYSQSSNVTALVCEKTSITGVDSVFLVQGQDEINCNDFENELIHLNLIFTIKNDSEVEENKIYQNIKLENIVLKELRNKSTNNEIGVDQCLDFEEVSGVSTLYPQETSQYTINLEFCSENKLGLKHGPGLFSIDTEFSYWNEGEEHIDWSRESIFSINCCDDDDDILLTESNKDQFLINERDLAAAGSIKNTCDINLINTEILSFVAGNSIILSSNVTIKPLYSFRLIISDCNVVEPDSSFKSKLVLNNSISSFHFYNMNGQKINDLKSMPYGSPIIIVEVFENGQIGQVKKEMFNPLFFNSNSAFRFSANRKKHIRTVQE